VALPRWFATKFIEGFIILVPALIAYLMLGQLFEALLSLTLPILDILPASLFGSEVDHRIVASLCLLAIFLLVGIAATTAPARRFGSWIETTLLDRFPPYTVFRSVANRLGGRDAPSQLQPALLTVAPDIRMLVAIVEELPDSQMTVFVPIAPTPGMGFLQIVSASKVDPLEASMSNALGWVLNWGIGTEALLGGDSSSQRGDQGLGNQEPGD
jgi:uncharacterized membrane protein